MDFGAPPQKLDEYWNEVLNNWQDDRVHQRFVGLCANSQNLDYAAARYREIGKKEPQKNEEAQRWITNIWTLSVQILSYAKTPPSKIRKKLFFMALVLSASMLFYALFILSKY